MNFFRGKSATFGIIVLVIVSIVAFGFIQLFSAPGSQASGPSPTVPPVTQAAQRLLTVDNNGSTRTAPTEPERTRDDAEPEEVSDTDASPTKEEEMQTYTGDGYQFTYSPFFTIEEPAPSGTSRYGEVESVVRVTSEQTQSWAEVATVSADEDTDEAAVMDCGASEDVGDCSTNTIGGRSFRTVENGSDMLYYAYVDGTVYSIRASFSDENSEETQMLRDVINSITIF